MIKTQSEHARCASAIRRLLKQQYPTVKFSVRSEIYSGGDAVRIEYTDGPPTEAIDRLVRQYEAGTFDGMIDLYEYNNSNPDLPQVKYITTHRSYSRQAIRECMEHVNAYYGTSMVFDDVSGWIKAGTDSWVEQAGFWSTTLIQQYQVRRTMVCPPCGAAAHITDDFCGECGERINGQG